MSLTEFFNRLRNFAARQDGTSTVEFVIIFPAIVLLIFAFTATSIYIATLSELQQVASDLARQSLRHVDLGQDSATICASLSAEMLPQVVSEFIFVTPERIVDVSCALEPDRSGLSVTVIYDLVGTPIDRLGSPVGMDVGTLSRVAEFRI